MEGRRWMDAMLGGLGTDLKKFLVMWIRIKLVSFGVESAIKRDSRDT